MIVSLLEEEILSDIKERSQLLLTTKTLSLRYSFNENDEQFYLNYSIPIVYSIWEGFMQTIFQTYIREINRLNLTTDVVCKQILVMDIENKFKQFRQYPEKLPQKTSFFNKLGAFFEQKFIQLIPVVNTQSNVGFDVMNKMLSDFNLEVISEYPISGNGYSIKDDLDKFLLKIRNNVSHGNNSIVVYREDLERAIKLIEFLMSLVSEKILDGYKVKKTHMYNA